ncbi:hypothetical protein Tco_0926692 [Tanacetum coccineum]|uniref:Uncharacterized protein n=1 Tax=Tanacetum coccineum TaxID=301880 RepID=A0ABQ5DCG7_9ASTR
MLLKILKKFDFWNVKTTSTPIETQRPLTKDEEATDVDVHFYRSIIGSLMYLTASRLDIMFAICNCSRFKVTPKTSHLNAVKRIFSDYVVQILTGNTPSGGCQFLGQRRFYPGSAKKQTIVATSTYTGRESMLLMLVLMLHEEKKAPIQVLSKIHTDNNVADLLTKAFDISRTCPKHIMIAYLEKTDRTLLSFMKYDFLTRSSIFLCSHFAGKPVSISEASIRSALLFDDANGINSLNNQAIFDGKHFLGKVTPLFPTMLVQPTEDEGEGLNRPSAPQPTPSPPHTNQHEPMPDPTPRPIPTIPDSIPQGAGGNLGDQSSNDRSLSGSEDGLSPHCSTDRCISLYVYRSRRKVVKSSKGEPSAHKDLAFDDDFEDLLDDAMDYQRTKDVKDKESTDLHQGTDTQKVSTDRVKESTDIEKVSTDNTKLSTDKVEEGTAELDDNEPKDNKEIRIEEEESDTASDDINETEKKFKMLAHDEEIARKMQEDWEAEEEKTQLRNQMMTYLKHIGNKQHSDLKNKTFEEIQVLYDKIKRYNDKFLDVGSTEDERKIKEMNDKAKDPRQKRLKKRVVKETPKEKDTAKEKTIATANDDSDDKHRKCLRVVALDSVIDSEVLETKSVIARVNKVSSPDGDYLVIYRANGNSGIHYLLDGLLTYI